MAQNQPIDGPKTIYPGSTPREWQYLPLVGGSVPEPPVLFRRQYAT